MAMSSIKNNNLFHIEGIPSNAVSIVESVAQEECAISSLLQAQADLLCKVINPCITVCDFADVINSIIRTMKTIVIKNNILENKLRETLNFIQKEGIECLDYNQQFELLNNLNSVLESISEEEFSIGHLIDQTGKIIALIDYCTFDDIKSVNDLVIALMRLIIEKNMILLRKLKTVISLIKFIKCSEFDIFIKVKKKLLCTIKKLVSSIFTEEKGLALLIHGESVKFHCALKMCIDSEQISILEDLINDTIDAVCDKKRILEYKLSETIDLLKTVGFSLSEIDSVMDYIKELQSSAFSGEFELSELIKEESKKLNKILDKVCFNYTELIKANIYITCSLACLLVNINTGRKNRKTYEFESSGCKNNSICKGMNRIINRLNNL